MGSPEPKTRISGEVDCNDSFKHVPKAVGEKREGKEHSDIPAYGDYTGPRRTEELAG